MKKIFLALTALAVLSSCTKEMLEEQTEVVDGTSITMEVLSPETRTVFGENQKSVLWEKQDQLSVFLKKADQTFGANTCFSKGTEANSFSGTFSKAEAPSETGTNTYYAIYPYDAKITSPEGAKLQIPSSLTQNGINNMDHLHVPLVGNGSAEGHQNPQIHMNHQAVVIKVVVRNTGKEALTVNSVKVTADAKLTGEYKVNAADLTISPEASALNTAQLQVGNATIAAGNEGIFYLMTSAFSLKAAGAKMSIEVATDKGNMVWEKFGKGMDFVAGIIYKIVFDFHATTEDEIIHLAGWKNVTSEMQAKSTIATNSPAMQIYRCDKINGAQGNVGYAITIPAGKAQMKFAARGLVPDSRMSPVVKANKDYSVFLSIQGPGCWGKAQGQEEYYSPVLFGSDGKVKKVLRTDGWNGKTKMYAPALAIKDGKFSMEYASSDQATNVFKKHDNVKGEGGVSWAEVDAAFGGYFQIVKDGNVLIASEGYDAYQKYTDTYRTYVPLNYATPSWLRDPVIKHDALRTGRIGVGCTAKGDLVLFMSDKFYNSHNQGHGKDAGYQGAVSKEQKLNGENQFIPDPRGVTLYELANVMKDLGCSDVMTVEDYYWSYLILQDGKDRGYDLVKTKIRTDNKELDNMFVVCFK